MELCESLPGGVNLFSFEHSLAYQQAQILFWEAVDLMQPEAFVVKNKNCLKNFFCKINWITII